ncbi:MAG: NUDIX domain-containing protein [Clostridiaceae bacterium]
MKIDFYEIGRVEDKNLEFAIISSRYKNEWILAKHKERNTWEIPGGHREKGEDINYTAKRELYEETGALKYNIEPVFDYSVTIDNVKSYGRMFYAEVFELGKLPELEIEKIQLFNELPSNLTYPLIQPYLQEKVIEYLKNTRRNC